MQANTAYAADETGLIHPFSALHTQASRDPIVWKEAQGLWLTTVAGERYLDAAAGLWCTNVGYGHPALVEAAARQMAATSSVHAFGQFSSEPLIALVDRLLAIAPPQIARVLFGNSGSDANDTQVKLVRRYNNVRGKPDKKKIIARRFGYHGSTIAAGSLTGIDLVHRTFDLPIAGVLHTHAPDFYRRPDRTLGEAPFSQWLADELDRQIRAEGPETVAAFIAEPITGAGGVFLPPEGYFAAIQPVLDRHDVLLICDEVITGFGRTGDWFASPGVGAAPDLISISKGLTSGYFPMSACLVSAKVADVLYGEQAQDGFFGHGFTASGHSVGAAVALANIDVIERDGLLHNAVAVGDYLKAQLRAHLGANPNIGDIRGRGLMIGVELDDAVHGGGAFADPGTAGSVLARAMLDERLIVRGGHGRVLAALAPALNLTRADADDIVERFVRGIDRFSATWRAHFA